MEMTGLVPESDRIIEVAIVVTDGQLNTIAEGPVLVVHQPDALMDAMDAWNKSTHKKSGLIERVKVSQLDEAQVEAQLIEFLQAHVPVSASPMCGNSICQDRRFMARSMPTLEAYFSARPPVGKSGEAGLGTSGHSWIAHGLRDRRCMLKIGLLGQLC